MKKLKRREFIKTVGAGSLGLAALNNFGSFLQANPLSNETGFMGGLTQFALLDDIACLATAGNQITFAAAELVKADINNPIAANLSRMGATVTATESSITETLKSIKQDFQKLNADISKDYESLKGSKTDLLKKKLVLDKKFAVILGWFMASGIRDYLNPLYSKSSADQPSEMSVYHDMFVLKQVAGKNEMATTEDLAALFHGMQPRAICRTHTITPDYDDGIAWTQRISDWRNDSRLLMKKYAQVYLQPDKTKTEKYIDSINFYNPDDTIIQLARWAQDAKPLKSIDNVLKPDTNQSIYAKCVIQGINALIKADKMLVS